MGFWSHRGGPVPHQQNGPFSPSANPHGYMAIFAKMFGAFDHLDGKDLLRAKHLTDEAGWMLPSRLIPYREFSSEDKRPVLVTDFDESIANWSSWYRWRKLPLESPAALIMDFPMSVYQLVVNCLEVTDPAQASADYRVSVQIQMLGVEVELNYLPV